MYTEYAIAALYSHVRALMMTRPPPSAAANTEPSN